LPALRRPLYLDARAPRGYSLSMASGAEFHHGVVHGKLIELDRVTGLPDGQEVRIIVQPVDRGRQSSQSETGVEADDEQAIWDELDRTAMSYEERDQLWKHFQSRDS
jgi:hypothetical protein